MRLINKLLQVIIVTTNNTIQPNLKNIRKLKIAIINMSLIKLSQILIVIQHMAPMLI